VLAVERAGGVGLRGRHAPPLVPVDLLAAGAVADPERAGGRPAVGEEAVDRVVPVDLAVDGRHLLGEVGAELAHLEEPGAFGVLARRAVAVALEPLPVALEGLPL